MAVACASRSSSPSRALPRPGLPFELEQLGRRADRSDRLVPSAVAPRRPHRAPRAAAVASSARSAASRSTLARRSGGRGAELRHAGLAHRTARRGDRRSRVSRPSASPRVAFHASRAASRGRASSSRSRPRPIRAPPGARTAGGASDAPARRAGACEPPPASWSEPLPTALGRLGRLEVRAERRSSASASSRASRAARCASRAARRRSVVAWASAWAERASSSIRSTAAASSPAARGGLRRCAAGRIRAPAEDDHPAHRPGRPRR